MKKFLVLISGLLFKYACLGQSFIIPTSGNAVDNKLSALTATDGVTLITSISSTGCAPGGGSTFRYGTDHVSTGAIYRNTSWAINCNRSSDIIKMDFSTQSVRPQGIKFSIYDVDNGSDSVSVLIYSLGVPINYTYFLYSPTFVFAHGISPYIGFNGSASNNSGLDDNRGRIDISTVDIMARVDSIIIYKYNNRDVTGNPSQSFASFEWTNFILLPLKIISFNASQQNGGVYFNWSVNNETGTEKYQVEYSTDGIIYQPTGTIITTKDLKDSEGHYRFYSPFPTKNSIHYFRLMTKEVNGKKIYSVIRKISKVINLKSSVYPVHFKSSVTLALESENNTKGNIQLAGMDGNVYLSQPIHIQKGNNNIFLPLPDNLIPGTYILICRPESGIVFRQIIFKQ